MRGTPWAPRGEDSQAEVRLPEERHGPMIGWKHQHENSQRFLGRDGQDRRMRGMRKPKRQETQCCMSEPARGVEDQAIPQPERMTRDTDTETQQDTQAPASSSSVHTPMTGIGDITVRPVLRDIMKH